jgi:hypothetical protein
LPRILELSATKRFWHPNPEIVARSLRRAEIASWPEPRQAVVREYFDAAFEAKLTSDHGGFDLDSWLCALGTLFPDVTPYLSRVAEDRRKLLELYEVNSECLAKGRLANGFWDDEADTSRQVIDWFRSPEITASIQNAYGLCGAPPTSSAPSA